MFIASSNVTKYCCKKSELVKWKFACIDWFILDVYQGFQLSNNIEFSDYQKRYVYIYDLYIYFNKWYEMEDKGLACSTASIMFYKHERQWIATARKL